MLLGLGLFVGGLLTGVPALYWACVAACAVAAVLLVLARRQGGEPAAPTGGSVADRPAAPPGTGERAAAGPTTTFPATGSTAALPAVHDDPQRSSGAPRGEADAADGSSAPPDAGPARTSPGIPVAPSVTASRSSRAPDAAPLVGRGEPPLEDVEFTDLLLVVDLPDEVLVVDEHPRYHLPGCPQLFGRETIPLPLAEARTDGFTPCGVCRPDGTLADRVRARRRGRP